MKLKGIISINIGSKYVSKNKKWNKIIIEKIMVDEANNEKIINLLN